MTARNNSNNNNKKSEWRETNSSISVVKGKGKKQQTELSSKKWQVSAKDGWVRFSQVSWDYNWVETTVTSRRVLHSRVQVLWSPQNICLLILLELEVFPKPPGSPSSLSEWITTGNTHVVLNTHPGKPKAVKFFRFFFLPLSTCEKLEDKGGCHMLGLETQAII